MANIDLPWEVEGVITPEKSVHSMIDVIQSKGIQHSGTFWTWQDTVCRFLSLSLSLNIKTIGLFSFFLSSVADNAPLDSNIPGEKMR